MYKRQALGAGLVVSSIIIAVIYFSKRIKKRSLAIERQFMANFQGTDGNVLSTESDTGSTLGSNIPFKDCLLYTSCDDETDGTYSNGDRRGMFYQRDTSGIN